MPLRESGGYPLIPPPGTDGLKLGKVDPFPLSTATRGRLRTSSLSHHRVPAPLPADVLLYRPRFGPLRRRREPSSRPTSAIVAFFPFQAASPPDFFCAEYSTFPFLSGSMPLIRSHLKNFFFPFSSFPFPLLSPVVSVK